MDRFFRGFVAGLLGGVVMIAWSLLAYYVLGISKMRYLDWSAVLMYGHMPRSTGEAVYALLIQLSFTGMLGIIMAYAFRLLGSRGYLLKGIIIGMAIGFIVYAIPSLLKTPGLMVIPLGSVISNHFGGLLWGLITAYSLHYLDQKSK